MAAQIPDFDQLQSAFQEKLETLKSGQLDLVAKTKALNGKFDGVWQQLMARDHGASDDNGEPMTAARYRDFLQEDMETVEALLAEVATGQEDQKEACRQHLIKMLQRLERRWLALLQSQVETKSDYAAVAARKSEYVAKFSSQATIEVLDEQEKQQLLMDFLLVFDEEDRVLKQTGFHLVELNQLLEVKEQLLTHAGQVMEG